MLTKCNHNCKQLFISKTKEIKVSLLGFTVLLLLIETEKAKICAVVFPIWF